MPNYVYSCENDHKWNIFHSIAEDPKLECEVCYAIMHRVPQATPVTFHTDGFYTTDKND